MFNSINELVEESDNDSIVFLKRDQITPDDKQSRRKIDQNHVNALAKSMALNIPDGQGGKRPYGIREALTVEKLDDGAYKIVKGYNRWLAAGQAKIDDIPCIIRDYTDRSTEKRFDHITENSLRKGLNLYDQALAIQEDLSNGISRKDITIIYNLNSDSQLSKLLSILKADTIIQEAAENEIITDINLVYELKSLKPDSLEKWQELVNNGESGRAAFSSVSPKKKKTKKKKNSSTNVSFSIKEIQGVLKKLGLEEGITDSRKAKALIMECVAND